MSENVLACRVKLGSDVIMQQIDDLQQVQLIDAIMASDVLSVKRLLQNGASCRYVLDDAKVTPLHFAAQGNAVDIIRLLLASGAPVQAKTHPDGETPYDIAKLHGHNEAMELLRAS